MSPNGNDPTEPFEEKKDGTVDETAQTSQNDKDAKKGKNNVLQMAFCLSFDLGLEIWPETFTFMSVVTSARLCQV